MSLLKIALRLAKVSSPPLSIITFLILLVGSICCLFDLGMSISLHSLKTFFFVMRPMVTLHFPSYILYCVRTPRKTKNYFIFVPLFQMPLKIVSFEQYQRIIPFYTCCTCSKIIRYFFANTFQTVHYKNFSLFSCIQGGIFRAKQPLPHTQKPPASKLSLPT